MPARTPEVPPRSAGPGGALLLGLALGALALTATGLPGCGGERPFEEIESYRPLASAADRALWAREWEARAKPWTDVPDPPGRGPIETGHWWLSRASYRLEVRRRGDRIVVAVNGVDEQTLGGGWTAFGEGRIRGPEKGFAGAEAVFSYSCLGIRYRHASDGIGRIRWNETGDGLVADYMAHENPEYWSRAYGRVADGPRPAYGSIRGQIPMSGGLPDFDAGKQYLVGVRVVDLQGAPVPGALVQVKGQQDTRRISDDAGRVELVFSGSRVHHAVVISAGAHGLFNGETATFVDDGTIGFVAGGRARGTVEVALQRLPPGDDPTYRWQEPRPDKDPDDAMACGTCHAWQYHEWQGSRHARAAAHGHVLYTHARVRAEAPEAPDDCRGCHQPGFASTPEGARYPGLQARGAIAGVHCDLCHKVHHIEDLHGSGVFGALAFRRPSPSADLRPGGIHQVFGTQPDVTYAYMGAVYNGLFAASHLCAACHQGGGRHDLPDAAPKLDTFEEWRRWAAEQARSGEEVQSCQGCHMAGGRTRTLAGDLVDQGAWDALHRTPGEVHSHAFFGTEAHFAAEALDVTIRKSRREDGDWDIEVAVENGGAGHKIPTGTWTKHVVIAVYARADGRWLTPRTGTALLAPPRSPDQAPAPPELAGAAGSVLGVHPPAAGATGESPASPAPLSPAHFWRADHVREGYRDQRLAPGEARTVRATYPGATDTAPVVEVRVLHRRGALPAAGLAQVPWPLGNYDPPPETLWKKVIE